MPLKVFVEDVESLDEGVRSFYKETEGGYILDAEPVNGYAVENVEGLTSALSKERTSRKDFEKRYTILSKKYEGVDLDEINELKDKYEKLAEIDPESEAAKIAEERIRQAEEKVNTKLSRKQKEWERLHQEEVGTREKKIESLTNQIKSLMIDNKAASALANAGVLPDSAELLMPKVKSAMKLVESEDGYSVEVVDQEGNSRVRSDGRNMTIEDLMPEFQNKWPSMFSADVKRGGGTKGSEGKPIVTKTEGATSHDKIRAGIEARRAAR